MEPDGEDYLTEGEGQRVGRNCSPSVASTDLIERERYEPPDTSNVSEAAKKLLRTCVESGCPEGHRQANRPAYRELVKARIMIPMGSFSQGDECVFRFTYLGWRQRFELAEAGRGTRTPIIAAQDKHHGEEEVSRLPSPRGNESDGHGKRLTPDPWRNVAANPEDAMNVQDPSPARRSPLLEGGPFPPSGTPTPSGSNASRSGSSRRVGTMSAGSSRSREPATS